MAMTLNWYNAANFEALGCDHNKILGGTILGGEQHAIPALPAQLVASARLGDGQESSVDAWVINTDEPVQSGVSDAIVWRRSGNLVFGLIEIDDSQTQAAEDSTPLQTATKQAYDQLFGFLAEQGTPHLWKLWTYMAEINTETHGLERYRQFNVGRAESFEAHKQALENNVPAACVLGTDGGPLTIAFLASSIHVTPIENPRQVSAFHYPDQYGPRKPLFARAAVARADGGRPILFISGTASIVGHETVHKGDVLAQTDECLNNIEALLNEVRNVTGDSFGWGDLAYRVYVKNAQDVEGIRDVVTQRIGSAHAVYLRADVCRSDLLVEIEAHST